ncbi:gliding motility-associated-like protein [Pontibacter mucosus]|uniref:Gliding motility-associated-like protein n=1 Tax=Pontibacter mucosus TaxID=1649266 RepID=A0A2T5YQ02_9BACT|nr:Ig-like domain-containing protein [Pontibacter mucosus]PTX21371.1 gliding motility-associated-like protein [Pontibacter mucosus]
MPLYFYLKQLHVRLLPLVFLTILYFSTAVIHAKPTALSAPTLEAKPSLAGAITLKWTAVAGATGYVLERSLAGPEGAFVPVKTLAASELTFRDTDLYYSQQAYYRIKATGSGATPYSNVASATTLPQNHVYRIMPLGDSNTEGGIPSDPVGARASYRAKLEQLLNGASIKFDYVGSERHGGNLVKDTDHAGFGGSRNEDLVTIIQNGWYDRWYDGERFGLDHTENYLEYFKPDVILLHSGTNEISNDGVDNSQSSVDDLTQILDEVDKYEQRSGKEVTVIVSRIILTVCTPTDCYRGPENTKNDIIERYNDKLEALVKARIKAGDRLELVDMADAGIIYQFVSDGGDMADRFHPAQRGFDKMAPVWFKVLDPLLNRALKPVDTTAPETEIAARPKELSNSSSAEFRFSSNENGVSYQVSINGGDFTTVPNPYTLANLADGEHTIRVRAVDAAGNIDASPATYTWMVDTKAPDAPVVTAPAQGSFLNTNKPTFNGIAEAGSTVALYFGTTKIGESIAAADGKWSLVPANALSEGTKQLTATATDAAGNTSKASSTRSFTIDTKAPETTIASGPDKMSNSKEASFSFSSSEENVNYEISLDGGAYAAAESKYTAQNLSEGSHTLSVRAVDAAGNKDQSPATYAWEVDTKAPEAPTMAGITEDRGPADDDQITSDNTLRFFGRAEPGAVAAVWQQENKLGTTVVKEDGTWEYSHEKTALREGKYTFTATATDAAGNTSPKSKELAVTIDLIAPEVAIKTEQESPVNTSFPVSITFTEEVYGLSASSVSITNGKLQDFKESSKATYTATVVPEADGEVRISLAAGKVTDLAGNPNPASEVLRLTYDAAAPAGYTLAFNTELVDITNQERVGLQVASAEPGATYFYSISSNKGGAPLTGTGAVASQSFTIDNLNLSGLSDGLLTATLYLVDAAGNRGEEISAQVEKLTKDIIAVINPADKTVKFKTGFEEIGLPQEVEVRYTFGSNEKLKVTWNPADYNSAIPGSYLILGQLELKENTSNSRNLTARVMVTVEPNQPPTAISLSADKFRPDLSPDEQIGTFSTTDPDDNTFVYTLVRGQGDADNPLFELREDGLYLKTNRGLSGKSAFSIRVRSTDPYNNTFEQQFTLTKSLYNTDGSIKLVNAFSPDGDNINDLWLVPELRYYNQVQVQVFDRSGTLLFETTDPEKGWDGKGKDGRVTAGSYFYIIQIKDINLVERGVLTVLN